MTGYRNKVGVERTVRAMRSLERLVEVDEARIALTRSTAAALDAVDPAEWPAQYASLARAHLAALAALEGGSDDDRALDLEGLLSAMGNDEDAEP